MKKKGLIVLLSLVSAASVTASVLLFSHFTKDSVITDSEPVTYAMEYDEHSPYYDVHDAGDDKHNIGTLKTNNGAGVDFAFSKSAKYDTTAAFIQFESGGGEIYNISPINGLITLKYSSNHDLNLYYGFSPNNLTDYAYLAATGHSWEDDGSYTFAVDYGRRAYIKISVPGECQLNRLKLYYSCIPSPDPYRIDGEWEYTIDKDDMFATITGYHCDSDKIPEDGVIVVPRKLAGHTVSGVCADVLTTVPWLKHLVLPFVGQNYRVEYSASTSFSSIFATHLAPGMTGYIPIQQHDGTWFIPQSLKTVTVLHGNSLDYSTEYMIPDYAFYGADNLEVINIYGPTKQGESTQYMTKQIGEFAFANIPNVKEIRLPASISHIAANAFAGNEDLIIRNYSSSKITPTMNPHFARVTENYVDTVSYNGVVYDLYKKDNNVYANAMGLDGFDGTDLHLDAPIVNGDKTYYCKSVANRAFQDESTLERVYLGDSMQYVGYYAFKGTYKATIILRDSSITDICMDNWDKDTGLVVLNYGGKASYSYLHVSYLPLGEGDQPDGYLADFIADGNVETLQLDQFDVNVPVYVSAYFADANENITSINLPKNLTMGDYAFFNCLNLKIVQYAGTVNEWNALVSSGRIGVNTFANTQVSEVICNGGTVPIN